MSQPRLAEQTQAADADLARRVAALEDIQAITVLKWRYLRACDRKQPEVVRDCFVPEAVIDFEGFPLFSDRDSFVEIYRKFGCRPNIVDMHHGQNPIIELTGPDTARGALDCYFFQIDTETRRHTQLSVGYDDEYVRRDGRWWIARSVSRRISMLVETIGEDGVGRVEVAGRSDQAGPTPPPR